MQRGMMSDKFELPVKRRFFQFTLGDLLVAMLGICVGLSVGRSGVKLPGMVLVAVMVWFVVGICSQIRDLWSTFHGREELSRDQRWGWRFAVFWRIGVVCLLVGYYVVAQLLNHKLLSLPEGEPEYLALGTALRSSVFYLALVVIMSAWPPRQARRPPTRWSTLVEYCSFLLGMLIALLLYANVMAISALVDVAISGIVAAQPVRFSDERSAACCADRSVLFWLSLAATLMLIVSLVLTRHFARSAAQGGCRQWLWGGLLLLMIPFTVLYPIWLVIAGFKQFSPYLADHIGSGVLHPWLAAAVLLIVAVTAIARRMASVPEASISADFHWRRHSQTYYHERGPVLGCLAVGIAFQLVAQGALYQKIWSWTEMFADPLTYLSISVLFLALRGVMLAFRLPTDLSSGPLPELRLSVFCTVWLAIAFLMPAAIVTLAALSFAVWFVL